MLREGRLADALRDLSVRSGSDLLFAPDVVGDLRNRRIAGDLLVQPILARLLEDTGLGFRQVGDRTWIVFRLEPEQPTALPEVLVIGRKTQNADIRRTENDIQGYRVATSEDVRSSHADNLDQFLRSRQTNNAEHFGPSSDPRTERASNRSEVDFHGLGANQTLVLVDGTRMPGTLSQNLDLGLYQPDVNGLPLLAIERIESLTGTAGGIYGPGATGGVINVILKRDYRGTEISTTYGAAERGDAVRRRVDARIGFTPDGGATDVMINVSRAENQGLRFSDRAFAQLGLQRRIANGGGGLPNDILDGIVIQSYYGDTLRLSRALGGASLGSTFTYLPLNSLGAGDGSVLLANAGKFPARLSPDGNGALRSLTNATTVTSVLLNARHRFGQHVEAVIDFIGWENEGRSVSAFGVTRTPVGILVSPGSPAAASFPFSGPVTVTVPFPGLETLVRNRMRTTRASAKVIFDLPARWRGEASYATGGTHNRIRETGWTFDRNFLISTAFIQPGENGEPTPMPFGPWDDFVTTLQAYKVPSVMDVDRKLRLRDATLRLAGPLVRRDAGDLTLTLLAERRREDATVTPWKENGVPSAPPGSDWSFSATTSSFYGELRAPMIARTSKPAFLRGLELQLAARYDAIQADIPGRGSLEPRSGYDRAAAVYTAGLRVFPLEQLLVRASIATGVLPPMPEQMAAGRYTLTADSSYRVIDDARGGEIVGARQPVEVLTYGSSKLRPERARTLALGLVWNPDGRSGPRISMDYTHTEKRGEIAEPGGADYFVAREALYPGRIVRNALTPEDIAAGYTGGVITQIDATFVNISRTSVDAIDMRVEQTFRIGQDRRLRLFGGATWTPSLTRRATPEAVLLQYAGVTDGPLRWRGNAGVAWEVGDLSLLFDGQYYDRYRGVGVLRKDNQKFSRTPSQVYLDASLAYRFRVAGQRSDVRDVEIRFGVQDLLNRSPPIEASYYGYSPYGDPRGRRFELSATARF